MDFPLIPTHADASAGSRLGSIVSTQSSTTRQHGAAAGFRQYLTDAGNRTAGTTDAQTSLRPAAGQRGSTFAETSPTMLHAAGRGSNSGAGRAVSASDDAQSLPNEMQMSDGAGAGVMPAQHTGRFAATTGPSVESSGVMTSAPQLDSGARADTAIGLDEGDATIPRMGRPATEGRVASTESDFGDGAAKSGADGLPTDASVGSRAMGSSVPVREQRIDVAPLTTRTHASPPVLQERAASMLLQHPSTVDIEPKTVGRQMGPGTVPWFVEQASPAHPGGPMPVSRPDQAPMAFATPALARAAEVEQLIQGGVSTHDSGSQPLTTASGGAQAGGSHTQSGAGFAAQAQELPGSAADDADEPAARIWRGVKSMLSHRGGTMTMRLEPHELGQLRVQMTLRDGVVQARFETVTAEAHALLKQTMGTLRTALEGQGLIVERLQVTTNHPTSNEPMQQDSQEQEDQANRDAGGDESRGRREEDAERPSQHAVRAMPFNTVLNGSMNE